MPKSSFFGTDATPTENTENSSFYTGAEETGQVESSFFEDNNEAYADVQTLGDLGAQIEADLAAAEQAAAEAEASKVSAAQSASNASASEVAAGASAGAAAASQAASATSETNAHNSELAAAQSETNAAASEASALASKNAAATSEANAASSASASATSANQAATSAGNASTSASAAATSESNAAASEAASATSEANALQSETNAASSAASALASKNAAATSAANALASENNAATSEANAGVSAGAAATSASNALTSESNAAQSEANAATSETSAAGSASSAASSASSAAGSAGSASTSATNASNSASAASTSATNASNSAASALASKNAAATSETNAAGSAGAAATSASNAATSASNASTSESNAASSAADAAQSALDAQLAAESVPTFSAETSMVYVSKQGSDANTGLFSYTPKLTLASAITAASSLISGGQPRVVVVVTDNGEYTENIVLPNEVSVWAPRAVLVGTQQLNAGSCSVWDRIYGGASNSILIDAVTQTGDPTFVFANLVDGRGKSGTLTGVDILRNGSSGRVLFSRMGQAFVPQDGIGVRDHGISGFGHIHFRFQDLYLAGNNSKGIQTNNANTNLIGAFDHILEIGSPNNTIAIRVIDSGSIVKVTASEIIADTVYEITAGELYLACPKLTGARTGTPTVLGAWAPSAADKFLYSPAAGQAVEGTITAFARSLLDDANASAMRSTLGVDAAGTDNSTPVTLAGSLDYLTISGQQITRNPIDLTTDVTGALPVAKGGTGAADAATARANLGLSNAKSSAFIFSFDGGGAVIETGAACEVMVPFDCTLVDWYAVTDQTATVATNLYRSTFAGYGTMTDIDNGSPPAVASAVKGNGSASGYSVTSISAGDVLRLAIASNDAAQRVAVMLRVTK